MTVSSQWEEATLFLKSNQCPDAFLYGNSQGDTVTIQFASPAAYALLSDELTDGQGCLHLSEPAAEALFDRIDAAGLWLKPM